MSTTIAISTGPDPVTPVNDAIQRARVEPDPVRQHHLATFASARMTGYLSDRDGSPAARLFHETADRLLQRAKLSNDLCQLTRLTLEALNLMDEALEI